MTALNDLLVLNAEIAALVRAGIPLELGLRRLSQTVSGRLGALAERLVVRLEQGDTLVTAIREEGGTVSPLYAAVIEAGIRSNHLPEALEGLVRFGRLLQSTRRQVEVALTYPVIVIAVAYLMFIYFAVWVMPQTIDAWDPLSPLRIYGLPWANRVRDTAFLWGPLVPIGVGLLLAGLARCRVYFSDTSFLVSEPGGRGILAGVWIPGIPQMYLDLDRAHAAEMLSLLLKHAVPLPEALKLVSRMTGSRQLSLALSQMGEMTLQGHSLGDAVRHNPALPRLYAHLLCAGLDDHDLAGALEQVSVIYQRRVQLRAAWLRSTLIPLFAVLIGGTAVLLYALAFGLPLRWLFLELMHQANR